MRRLLIAGSLILGALLIATVFAAVRINAFLHTPVAVNEEGATFEIVPGASFRSVSEELASQSIIEHPEVFRVYARWVGQANAIQAGDYMIRFGTTPVQLLQQFTSGDVQLYPFTIVEGWNQWELLDALHQNANIEASLTDEDWPALLDELDAATHHPEGLFLPETYHIARGTTDRALLKQAYDLMQAVLREEWAGRDGELPVKTEYEALILASIIEKETARADERAKISGVFIRRLGKRMRLQTDPTVIYGIGKAFNGNLTRKDLQTDTPYNTYTRHGLPPTPIAMPGRAAINAALHPANGEELYFVATGLGDGSHAFSATKAEHDSAVAEYLKRLRQQRREGN